MSFACLVFIMGRYALLWCAAHSVTHLNVRSLFRACHALPNKKYTALNVVAEETKTSHSVILAGRRGSSGSNGKKDYYF